MTSRFIEIGPGQTLVPTIKEAVQDDNFFIGGYKKLMQGSVSQGHVTKDYGDIMAGEIFSMVQTSEKKYLFVSDQQGCQKQIDVRKQKVVMDYGKIHEYTTSIAISSDGKYLFTSSNEDNGHVKQFSLSDGKMIKDYGPIFGDGVRSLTTTHDNKWLFAASDGGHLKQVSLESHVVHDYEKIHDNAITSLETARDSKWLITGSYDGHVKRISVQNRQVDKDLGEVCEHSIMRMKITPDGEGLLVADQSGRLKLISSRDGKVIKDFERALDGPITGIVITADQKFLFTSSRNGVLKQWNYEDNTLVTDHREIINRISSLCL